MNSASNHIAASKLLRAVLVKALIEMLFVCAVATFAAFANFNPLLRGAIDVADQDRIAGWVHDPISPDEAIEVQLFIDGRHLASMTANGRRDDLVKAGATANPDHGFSFNLGQHSIEPGLHSIQVYAVRNSSGGPKALIPIARAAMTIRIAIR